MNLKDRTKSQNKHVLVIGDSGSGKTTFLGSVPDVWIADFDSGLDVLAGKDISYTEFFDGDTPSAWVAFKKELDVWKKEPKGPALGLDSITTAAEAALKYILHKNGRFTTGRIEIGDWGQAINEVKDALAKLSVLKCHVIVTAHYQMHKDEQLGGLYFVPLLYGRELPMMVPKFFNDAWRTYVELKAGGTEPAYKLQVRPDSRYSTLKNTLGIKELSVVPDFSKLIGG